MQTKSTAGTATAGHGRRGEHELPAPKLAVEKEVLCFARTTPWLPGAGRSGL